MTLLKVLQTAGLFQAWSCVRGRAGPTLPCGFISSYHRSPSQWQSMDASLHLILGPKAAQPFPNTHQGNNQMWNKKLFFFLTLKAAETKGLFFFFLKQYILREWEIKFEESLPIRKPPFNYNTQEITEWMAGTVIRDWHRRMTGTEIRPLHHKATYHKSLSGRLTIWLYCQLNS